LVIEGHMHLFNKDYL